MVEQTSRAFFNPQSPVPSSQSPVLPIKESPVSHDPLDIALTRRSLLAAGAGLVASSFLPRSVLAEDGPEGAPTRFQLACMTLPFSLFPFAVALRQIKLAGFEYVAWGTTHFEHGGGTPVLGTHAKPDEARSRAKECRDAGLKPVMMFSMRYPEAADAVEVLTNRILQAEAAGIGQVLTFGHTKGGNRALWIERFTALAPIAADHGVTLVIKQHGGETGTGEACARIVREVDHPNVRVNYDAGNVMDYLDVDPIPDIETCAAEVHSFCIKDHRNWPQDQDCGPGWGEIDHYRLLRPVAFTGRTLPLCFENVFPPLLDRPRPEQPRAAETVGRYARQCREYLELVIAGLQANAQ
jgi:sugar phosphate isomerase/epimerase